ncbi:uncharacterized protein PFL1_03258 [Pseudozyma flocculosa PF-1]|uniref:RNA helicase n=2 Tax=Pseudozyma flocculosa TaxID=84751 RepID=A0A5C3F997_9BASI|nr:uncharacterized protein PFL1_03258 [Pseudozyma flocculosa PF-1]EPQ28968.1 hypothetical protein PFL1_03258 [Pseudozyma flocculosa PF-1]SPO39961.1 probable DNA/RNA helicase (DEAD/H box family II) [Pseudozyma flocculosa]
MGAKKKKPTLKANPNRGFATSSLPKKPDESKPPAPAANTGTGTGSSVPTASSAAAGGIQPDANARQAAASAYADVNNDRLTSAGSASAAGTASADHFDPAKEEEQALQNLVDRLQDKVEKEVSRQFKAIEYDRRLSKTLPNFDLDPNLRDQILGLAASLQAARTSASAPASDAVPQPTSLDTDAADGSDTASRLASTISSPSLAASGFTPDGTQTPTTSTSGSMTPLKLGAGTTSIAMASLSRDLQSMALQNTAASSSSSGASSAFADSEDKVMVRALTTYQLLIKLGFTPANAETALAYASSPDLEECLAYLFLTLDEAALEDCLRVGEGQGVKKRRDQQRSTRDSGRGDDDEDDDTYDDSRPPAYAGYEFERRELLGRSQASATDSLASTSKVPGAAGAVTDAKTAMAQEMASRKAGSADVRASSGTAPAVSKEVVDALKKSSEQLALELNALLDSEQIDTLQQPSPTWSLLRVTQIRVDQERAKWKKELGKASLDRMNAEEGRFERVVGRSKDLMRECERMHGFNRKQADEGFKAMLRRREEAERDAKAKLEEEAQLREERRKEVERAASGGDVDRSDEEHGAGAKGGGSSDAAGPYQAAKADGAKEAAGEDDDEDQDKDDRASDSGSEGGLFGDMLDEQPTEATDAATGVVVSLRELPVQAKSGSGGKTPRVLLSDALKRADAYAFHKFEKIASGGRLHRSKLTIRWNGGKVVPNKNAVSAGAPTYLDEYRLTTVGCASQQQADDLIATVALFCIEHDKPIQRSLPAGYREWWDELEALRKDERDGKHRTRFQRVRDVVKARMDEANRNKKAKAKPAASSSIANDQAQSDLGELARGGVPQPSEEKAKGISDYFAQRVASKPYQAMLPGRQGLPIAKYRQEILDIVESSQIFVLSGETGCGKSTQVPAYILEDCMAKGRNCKIYVTEPRRISAISLAERVSEELGEPRGSVGTGDSLVGYAIRLESHVGRNARLVYATTGIVLRMLEGTAFDDITHVIIDEVHERSIESDFLLIILKTLIEHRKDLKVVLMSATVDAERISAYCGGCPTIAVPGRTFPVDVHYLEDAVELTNYTLEDNSAYAKRQRRGGRGGSDYTRKADAPGGNKSRLQVVEDDDAPPDDDDDDDDDGRGPAAGALASSSEAKSYRAKTIETIEKMNEYTINHELIVRILERVCFEKDLRDYSAATLIFLPGLADIRKCHDMLNDHPIFGGSTFRLYPLHSTISSENQGAVFNVPPKGVRKIVIATNIAETGITIPDITCVIDSGKHREMRFDEKRQISRLVECFVAKSNAKQRRGRAGRVQRGICFHLFTRLRHDSYFDDHPLPEMLRLSLQDLALKLKVMKIRIGTSIENALSLALDPPSSTNVQRAIAALIEVKALTANEDITPLGRHLSRLPLDVHMGKFLLTASLFKCLDPALTIAAALNAKSPFVTPFGKEAEADRAKQSFKLGDSDFLTIANAFNGWRRSVALNHHQVFCQKSFLSPQNLVQIEELRQQYLGYLIDSGFVTVDADTQRELTKLRYRSGGGGANVRKPRFVTLPAELDANSTSIAMVHAAIATGLYPKLLHIDPKSYQLRTIGNNQPASVHPSSVNFRTKMSELVRGSASYLLYFTMMQSKKLYAWETGVLDDKAVFTLCGDAEFKLSAYSMYIDRQRIRMAIPDPKSLLALKVLREQLARLLNTSFRNPGKTWTVEQTRFFQIACDALGVGANEKDLALQL